MKKLFLGIIIFLLGILCTIFYFRLSVWPRQLESLQILCNDNAGLLYTGDWVLKIAFPAFFLLGASIILFIVFSLKARNENAEIIDNKPIDSDTHKMEEKI